MIRRLLFARKSVRPDEKRVIALSLCKQESAYEFGFLFDFLLFNKLGIVDNDQNVNKTLVE